MSAWADPRYSRRGSRPLAGCWKAPSGAILVAHAGGAKGPQHCYPAAVRRGGRAVEGTGLENRRARKGLVGSNPTPSADSLSFSSTRLGRWRRHALSSSRCFPIRPPRGPAARAADGLETARAPQSPVTPVSKIKTQGVKHRDSPHEPPRTARTWVWRTLSTATVSPSPKYTSHAFCRSAAYADDDQW